MSREILIGTAARSLRIHSGLDSSLPWHPQREQMQGTRGIGGSHVTRRAAFALPAVGSFTSELQLQFDRIFKERISNLIIKERFTKLIGVNLKTEKQELDEKKQLAKLSPDSV